MVSLRTRQFKSVCTSLYVRLWRLLLNSIVCSFLYRDMSVGSPVSSFTHYKNEGKRCVCLSSQGLFCVCFPTLLLAESTIGCGLSWAGLHCSLSLSDFLLCSDIPCLLRCLTILQCWPLNSFIITLFFVLFQPPSHTWPWEASFFFVFVFAVTGDKEFVSSLIALSC